jgi:hypothetical protein
MLALASTSTIIFLAPDELGSFATICFRNGRAKPNASRISAAQRNASSNKCSSRLRLVSRGGVGCRNINELKSARSFVDRQAADKE